jgi:hypothetical protein
LDAGADSTDMGDVSGGAEGPVAYPADLILSPLTPWHVTHYRTIADRDPTLADDVFMKVGASTTVSNNFLKCFAGTNVDLGAHTHLRSTLDFFLAGDAAGGDPFSRTSLAAKSGVSAGWALTGAPSPLDAEYAALGPRWAFVHYGTNDMGLGSTYLSALWPFAENLWTLVDTLLERGVIPILATIQRRLDRPAADLWVSTYNGVIRAIAQGRQIPLVDMWLANEPLPRHGLGSDGLHSSVHDEGACHLTNAGLQFGMNHRNFQMATMLQRLEALLLDGESADPAAETINGTGTMDDPIAVHALPFQDLRDTRTSASRGFDRYGGCDAGQNEGGPEFVYRLNISATARIRATVHDLGSVDIDLHLLDSRGTPEGCVRRDHQVIEATLSEGTWYLVADTFVSSGGQERAGEYVLSVIMCPAEDPNCGE